MPGRMEAGQVFTIEPMINPGTANLDQWKDGWTTVTMNEEDQHNSKKLSCELGSDAN